VHGEVAAAVPVAFLREGAVLVQRVAQVAGGDAELAGVHLRGVGEQDRLDGAVQFGLDRGGEFVDGGGDRGGVPWGDQPGGAGGRGGGEDRGQRLAGERAARPELGGGADPGGGFGGVDAQQLPQQRPGGGAAAGAARRRCSVSAMRR
jgi:hypothetical protein